MRLSDRCTFLEAHLIWCTLLKAPGPVRDSLLNRLARCRKSWALEKEESTFIDWQRAKVQETTDEARLLAPASPPRLNS